MGRSVAHGAGQHLATRHRCALPRSNSGLRPSRRQPAVIASITSVAVACAAKAATMSIPIVFEVAGEPAEAGLVKSLTEPEAQSHGQWFALDGGITERLWIREPQGLPALL